MDEIAHRLKEHVRQLTVVIGERSLRDPKGLAAARNYIESSYRQYGLKVTDQYYSIVDLSVANVVCQLDLGLNLGFRYVLGAHYDCLEGTVGADDNAAAIAVQLETARSLRELADRGALGCSVTFVAFVLEEPPFFGTKHMGSKVYVDKAKREGHRIDGMICLEMVGYYCEEPGCQNYPFPLMFMGYPKTGDFIGIVGNFASRRLTQSVKEAFRQNPNLPAISVTIPLNGWLVPSVRLSDHSSFWDAGYNAVMITDSAFYRNPYYHTPFDTIDKLDFKKMAELVRSLVIFFSSQK